MENQRIIGFDLARTYAIFGMFIVNFNIVFGNFNDKTGLNYFLSMFSGNSATVFVMLAGMGVALMTNRENYTNEDKVRLRNTILKRALFLFVIGLLLQTFWPADILHFYGGYMTIAAFLLFVKRKYYLWVSVLSILIFHLLFIFIPFETNWNFETLHYHNFWTPNGFVTNFFYNGWNSVFPWLAFFTTGLYLGRLKWQELKTQKKMFMIGLFLYLQVIVIQFLTNTFTGNVELQELINADYLPPMLPFMLSTTGFGFMLISLFMFLGNLVANKKWANDLAKVGQMTLTHYISHLTIGLFIFAKIYSTAFIKKVSGQKFVEPEYILLFSVFYFILSFIFTKLWTMKFKNGPFETIMRKVSE
jgi:uncharacterized protein